MSLLQLLVLPDRVRLACDTLAEDETASAPFEVNKVMLLPSANVAIAGRGNFLAARVLWSLLAAAQDFTFDSADAQVRGALAAGRPLLPPHLSMALELVVAGVTGAGQPAAKLWAISAAGQVTDYVPDVRDIIAPWSGPEGPPVAPDSDANSLTLARLQAQQVRASAVGGRLIVAEISRGCMSVRDLGTFR